MFFSTKKVNFFSLKILKSTFTLSSRIYQYVNIVHFKSLTTKKTSPASQYVCAGGFKFPHNTSATYIMYIAPSADKCENF